MCESTSLGVFLLLIQSKALRNATTRLSSASSLIYTQMYRGILSSQFQVSENGVGPDVLCLLYLSLTPIRHVLLLILLLPRLRIIARLSILCSTTKFGHMSSTCPPPTHILYHHQLSCFPELTLVSPSY